MKVFWIDLFSGAGGTTTGIHLTGNDNVKVVACVNHDAIAIESHKANHPDCLHFVEDVRDFQVVLKLKSLVADLRKQYPGCKINLWASLECTNYSKAKGGLPRDADSRTLAYALYEYVIELDPDFVYIENVREFMAWGPLDDRGKPVSKLNGRDYIRWIKRMCLLGGYNYEWKLINAADFGAYTSRERYFGIFAKHGLPVVWPEPTHTKNPGTGKLFVQQKKWKAVRDVLDLNDEGADIFDRKKPLVDATCERIYAGLIKFVANGNSDWLLKYNSVNQESKRHNPPSINEPCPVVSTQSRLGYINCHFISKYFSGRPEHKNISVDGPAGTIKTKDGQALVNCEFLAAYYSTGDNVSSIDQPAATLTTKDRLAKVHACFLDHSANDCKFFMNQYSNGGQHSDINAPPAPTVTSVPKSNLVCPKFIMDTNFNNIGSDLDNPLGTITASHKYHYLLNPQFASAGSSLENPCFTLIARMDKRPPYLIVTENGQLAITISDNDTEIVKKIKAFMAAFGIAQIKMRMLKIIELKRIQGFPENYILKGSQADQKKFIGNAVHPIVACELANCNAISLASALLFQHSNNTINIFPNVQ